MRYSTRKFLKKQYPLPVTSRFFPDSRGKVKGRKASSDFVNGDFTDEAVSSRFLSNADIVFATATFFNKGELEASLSSLKVGAKVVTVDERIRGKEFQFIEEVRDAAGDLQLNTGYVYEKVA